MDGCWNQTTQGRVGWNVRQPRHRVGRPPAAPIEDTTDLVSATAEDALTSCSAPPPTFRKGTMRKETTVVGTEVTI